MPGSRLVSLFGLLIGLLTSAIAPARAADYCVVVSQATYDDPQWKPVVEALVAKHRAEVLPFSQQVADALPRLQKDFPRYICFVAQPGEATRQFVSDVSRLTRRLDDDPYTDAVWGILTGYNAADALRVAQHNEPLVIRRVAAGTEVALECCEEGIWYCELNQHKVVRKTPGEKPTELKGPADTTAALVDVLNTYQPDLFVTSGHATERDWQIGFRYKNGYFKSGDGNFYGLDTAGQRYDIRSANPKVYLPVGNCLMGHIDSQDAMALAFMHRAGVYQMIGYTVPTWYGYGGWGLLDYFVEQPGRYTLAEAHYANQQALVHRAQTYFGDLKLDALPAQRVEPKLTAAAQAAGLTAQDAAGLAHDSDTVAFYGDPAWPATVLPGPRAWEQALTIDGNRYTFEIFPQRGTQSFEPLNRNGSQRGGRPILHFLPRRIDPQSVKIIAGADLQPTITDNFLLVPLPEKCDPNRTYRIVLEAERVE